jgi:ABC-type polysaccharide/polyol phosphate transport system ATPase subunit
MAVIEVHDVRKSFRIPSARRDTVREHALSFFRRRTFRELRVLDGVSFDLAPGETLGIMGRNGCGKSTLLKIIAGIYQPDGGTVVSRAPITPILELGVGWNPELDAMDNVYLVGTVMGMTLAELADATPGIFEFAGLTEFKSLQLKYFSSGMAARLAYSIAFRAVRQGVLILDEIFAVGDAEFRERCRERYREIHRAGNAILQVSHNPDDISRSCERALLLEQGRVVFQGSGEDVARAYLELLQRKEERELVGAQTTG